MSGEVVCWGSDEGGESSPPGIVVMSSTPTPESSASRSSAPVDAAVLPVTILARFSTSDPLEGEERADAAAGIIAQHTSGATDTTRVLDLLQVVAPHLPADARRDFAEDLAAKSKDGSWDEHEVADAVFFLAALIALSEPNVGERVEAAHEPAVLLEAGELELWQALDLMDIIAPGLGINERGLAADALMELSIADGWDNNDRVAAASEVFKLVTGVPLVVEARIDAGVDLAGLGVRIFGSEGQWSDRDLLAATSVIKQAMEGRLTPESLAGTLGGVSE